MSDIAIEVDNVWKRFRRGERATTMRDAIPNALRWLRGQGGQSSGRTEFWALKDLSFQVNRGQTLGIIGPNGAGKSTILKILAGIMRPNKGTVQVNGRLSALIEVGAGFNEDLTGRENVYLNGSIMGLKKREIDAKFDQIVEFSGVEEFIDTPLKRYSSGMQVRLGFAVAAHLDPEILVVDEVLAVGDAEFQKKCLARMENVTHEGKTVLLVSHNMASIGSLCDNAVLLKHGAVERMGETKEVISYYLNEALGEMAEEKVVPDDRHKGFSLTRGAKGLRISCGDPLTMTFRVACPKPLADATAGIVLYDMYDSPVVGASSKVQGMAGKGKAAEWEIVCNMGVLPLTDGRYHASLWFGDRHSDQARFSRVVVLDVLPADPFGWGNKVPESWGHFYWKAEWVARPLP